MLGSLPLPTPVDGEKAESLGLGIAVFGMHCISQGLLGSGHGRYRGFRLTRLDSEQVSGGRYQIRSMQPATYLSHVITGWQRPEMPRGQLYGTRVVWVYRGRRRLRKGVGIQLCRWGLHLGTEEAALTLQLVGSGLGWEALGPVLFAILW